MSKRRGGNDWGGLKTPSIVSPRSRPSAEPNVYGRPEVRSAKISLKQGRSRLGFGRHCVFPAPMLAACRRCVEAIRRTTSMHGRRCCGPPWRHKTSLEASPSKPRRTEQTIEHRRPRCNSQGRLTAVRKPLRWRRDCSGTNGTTSAPARKMVGRTIRVNCIRAFRIRPPSGALVDHQVGCPECCAHHTHTNTHIDVAFLFLSPSPHVRATTGAARGGDATLAQQVAGAQDAIFGQSSAHSLATRRRFSSRSCR